MLPMLEGMKLDNPALAHQHAGSADQASAKQDEAVGFRSGRDKALKSGIARDLTVWSGRRGDDRVAAYWLLDRVNAWLQSQARRGEIEKPTALVLLDCARQGTQQISRTGGRKRLGDIQGKAS